MQAIGNEAEVSQTLSEELYLAIFLENEGMYIQVCSGKKRDFLQSFFIGCEESYAESFKELFRTTPILTEFNEAKVIVRTDNYTLTAIEGYTSHSSLQEGEEVEEGIRISSPLGKNCEISFIMEKDVYEFIRHFYPNSTFYPHIKNVLNYASRCGRRGDKSCFVICDKENMDIISYRNGKLVLSNTYVVKYPVDIFYYVASAWKELNFSPDTLLCLNTSEEMKEELIPYLSKCFSKVEFTPIETEIRKGKSLTYDFRLFLNEDY